MLSVNEQITMMSRDAPKAVMWLNGVRG